MPKRGWFSRKFEKITGMREDDARLIKGVYGYYSNGPNGHHAAMHGNIRVDEVIAFVAWRSAEDAFDATAAHVDCIHATDEGGRAIDLHLDLPINVILENREHMLISKLRRVTFPQLAERELTDIILSKDTLSKVKLIYGTPIWDAVEF
jgi:hypothetical protein